MKDLSKKVITAALAALPMVGFAQFFPPVQPQVNVRTLSDITQIIVNLVNWVMGLFFVVAVLFLFWAAYLYLSAEGDPERLGKAKDQLIYSVIAIAVALLAGSVRYIVENILNR